MSSLSRKEMPWRNAEDENRWKAISVAQFSQHCGPKLPHFLSRENWLWTQQSFSRRHSVQGLRFESKLPSTKFAYAELTNCPRCSWAKQTSVVFRDFGENSMQAFIKHKVCDDTKTNAPTLEERDYFYILRLELDYQGSKARFTWFGWIGLYLLAKAFPNTTYKIRKVGTDKTQALHRMQPQSFMSGEPITDV